MVIETFGRQPVSESWLVLHHVLRLNHVNKLHCCHHHQLAWKHQRHGIQLFHHLKASEPANLISVQHSKQQHCLMLSLIL
jgi:hypothetical protein